MEWLVPGYWFNFGSIGKVGARTLRVWLGLLYLVLVPSLPSVSWSPWGERLLPHVSHSYNDFPKCIRPRAMAWITWNHEIKETLHPNVVEDICLQQPNARLVHPHCFWKAVKSKSLWRKSKVSMSFRMSVMSLIHLWWIICCQGWSFSTTAVGASIPALALPVQSRPDITPVPRWFAYPPSWVNCPRWAVSGGCIGSGAGQGREGSHATDTSHSEPGLWMGHFDDFLRNLNFLSWVNMIFF